MIDLYNYKQTLNEKNIIYSFSGPINHDIIENMGNSVREKISKDKQGNKEIGLKVFSIFVEQVQNVINYSAEKDPTNNSLSLGKVIVGKTKDGYFISAGNKIANDNVDRLETMLKKLKSMGQSELKSYYKSKRREEPEWDSKGAGIGFIEMARKSNKPIEYNFQTIDAKYSFFSVEINIEGIITNMENLYIEETKSTPKIDFNCATNILSIKGESYPENTAQFYEPILQWIEDYLENINNDLLTLNIELIYFNSSSSKVLMDTFDILDEASSHGKNIVINWIYDEENDSALEYGEEFAEDIQYLKFQLTKKNNI